MGVDQGHKSLSKPVKRCNVDQRKQEQHQIGCGPARGAEASARATTPATRAQRLLIPTDLRSGGRADNEATDRQPHSSSEIRFHAWWFHGSFQFPQLQTPLLLHTLCLSKQAYRRIAHRAKCLIHLQVHILCLLMPSKVCAWRASATRTLVSKPALTLVSCPLESL